MLLKNEDKETEVLLGRVMVKKSRTENKEIGEAGTKANKGTKGCFDGSAST
jgi:hypothetical protein